MLLNPEITENITGFMKKTEFSYTNQDKKGEISLYFPISSDSQPYELKNMELLKNPFFPFEPLPHTA